MNRREFLKKCVLAGTAAGAAGFFSGTSRMFGAEKTDNACDLVALKNGEPGEMFDKGIEAIGGMKQFVRQGQTVLIKPNMTWDGIPGTGANTHPALVKRIVEQCFKAGAKTVYITDNILVLNSQSISGVSKAAKEAGAVDYPADDLKYYREVTIPGAVILKKAQVHELVADTDVFINVPVLKNHGGTKLSCALKNLMGLVWDRKFYHSEGLDQCIADFPLYRRPVLNVVDAYYVMVTGGPRGRKDSKVITPKMQFISTDIVAVDAVSLAQARQWGVVDGDVPYIKMASDNHLGKMEIPKMKIRKISV